MKNWSRDDRLELGVMMKKLKRDFIDRDIDNAEREELEKRIDKTIERINKDEAGEAGQEPLNLLIDSCFEVLESRMNETDEMSELRGGTIKVEQKW